MKRTAIAVALLASAQMVSAGEMNGINYNQVGIGFGTITQDINISGVGVDGSFSGAGISGTVLVAENILLGFSSQSASGTLKAAGISLDTDISAVSFGVGYRYPVASGIDIVPILQHISSKADIELLGSYKVNTTVFGMLLNGRLTDSIQAGVSYVTDFDNDEYGTTFGVNGLFKVNQTFGIGLDYGVSSNDISDSTSVIISANYLF